MMTTDTKNIMDRLTEIKSDLDYLKGHLVDVDAVLTDDDLDALKEAEDDFSKGKTKRI